MFYERERQNRPAVKGSIKLTKRFKILIAPALVVGLSVSATLTFPQKTIPSPTAEQSSPCKETPFFCPAAYKTIGTYWGGAWSSANSDGRNFFNRERNHHFQKHAESILKESGDPDAERRIVSLKSRSFLPDPRAPVSESVGDGVLTEKILVFIQFEEQPTENLKREILDRNVLLLHPVGGLTHVASGIRADLKAIRELPGVRAFARLDYRDKIHPSLFRKEIPEYARANGGCLRLRILGFTKTANVEPPTWSEAVQKRLVAYAGEWRGGDDLSPIAEVVIPHAQLANLAESPDIHYVEPTAPPVRQSAVQVAQQSNVDDVRDGAPLLSGNGVSVAIREIGQASAHADFQSRLAFKELDGDTGSFSAGHATGVTGVLGSAGSTQPLTKGMAPNVSMLFYTTKENGMADGFLQTNDLTSAAGLGVRISTHSYGPAIGSGNKALFGSYGSDSAHWDQTIATNDLVVIFAAGNERHDGDGTWVAGELYDNIDYLSGSKNIIAVGSVGESARAADSDAGTPAAVEYTTFSSYGPMDDGRVKPDLVAGGVNVTTTLGTNSAQTTSGTSFSAPAVAGMTALIFEHWGAKIGGQPSAAMLKALLLTTASDLGDIGPDAKTGYGIADVKSAAYLINRHESPTSSPFISDSITEGQILSYSFSITTETVLRAGLCWFDPAGSPMAEKALVNDLDLEFVSPTGVIHHPFSLNALPPNQAATNSGPNRSDSFELLDVAAPEAGAWTVRVKGISIPQGPQTFSLVISKPAITTVSAVISASPTFGAAPLDIYFSAAGSAGPINSYDWDFGDGNFGDGLNAIHTFSSPGVYAVRLTVTGIGGTSSSTAATVITVTRREVKGFPSSAKASLDFEKSQRDSLTLTMTIGELALPTQAAKLALRDGVFEGREFSVRIGGTSVRTFLLNRRAQHRDKDASLRLNPRTGRILVTLKKTDLYDLFSALGMNEKTDSGETYAMPVAIESPDAVYESSFSLEYKNNKGRTARAFTSAR
jgi:PKD repeat protein